MEIKEKILSRLPMRLFMSYGGVEALFVRRIPAAAYEHEMASPSIPRPSPRPSLLLVRSAPVGLKRQEFSDEVKPNQETAKWREISALSFLWFYYYLQSTPVSSNEDNYFHRERVIKNWVESSCESGQDEDKSSLKDLLFFLHVPRTGGRTYFHCFLRKLYTSAQECPRSYDKLRFDPSKPNCRLVVSHDDYSLISKLPKDRTSVVTIFRKPVDRVFSTYEFSVEVAARFLVHPNLTSAKQMPSRIRPKSRGVSTLDIWPWKYLVPWMREDLFDRRNARKLGKLRRINEITDPYNMEEMVMPLHDFINDPVAHEIVHNGATFQVAGLTNNSYFSKAHEVRQCVRKHPTLGRAVLEVAKSRLDRMLYVGLTEDHKKSARLFVNMVEAQVLSQPEALSSSDVETEALARTESKTRGPDQVQSSNYSQLGTEVPSPMDATPAEANLIKLSYMFSDMFLISFN